MERTLVIIKPNAIRTGNMGEIIQRLEKHGFRIIALKMLRLSRDEAENFYY
ncbi:MAG: nucleoside-diphosphate kinase, partial [bacterium]|nr:nucleoside-diphosphate kinase [bacterium]